VFGEFNSVRGPGPSASLRFAQDDSGEAKHTGRMPVPRML